MDNKKPVNEDVSSEKTKRMADIKMAVSLGIVFGIGVASGWYLTVSGFFG